MDLRAIDTDDLVLELKRRGISCNRAGFCALSGAARAEGIAAGAEFRRIRLARNIEARHVAELLEISPSMVSQIETGKRPAAATIHLARLKALLNTVPIEGTQTIAV